MSKVTPQPKIGFVSLGCPKNQVDLDVMVHILLSAGHETVADLAEADVILVNTCGFIESAKTEAIENILEACSYKQQNPDLKVIVTGCLAERYRSQIEEEIPEVDAVVGCASNKAIDTIVERLFHGEDHLESYGAKKDFPLGGKRVIGTPAHYAYLKIAEGCNNRCHYCAIPGIRGPLRSREIKDCVAEARWLAGEGVKELIVVAQDPTAYGEDWGKPGSICELLDKLNKVPGLEWIRIMYAYPERITDEFIAAMKRNDKVVPYLDLPIQHCNDTILKNMNRRSTRAELLEVIGKLRREIPIAIKECMNHEGIQGALVSHGSSTVPRYIVDEINALGGNIQNAYGISKEELKAAIPCGIGKINVDTDIRLAVTRNFRELFRDHPELKEDAKVGGIWKLLDEKRDAFDPRAFLAPIMDTVMYGTGDEGAVALITDAMRRGVKEAVGTLIVEFGSYGKAPLVEPATLEDMAARYAKEG